MLIDLTVIDGVYILEVGNDLLNNENLIHLSKSDAIKSMYPDLGAFEVSGNKLGLGGCFVLQATNNGNSIYGALLTSLGDIESRRIIFTYHLISRFVVEPLDTNGASLRNSEWQGQSFTLNALNGGKEGGFDLCGRLYPWFIKTIGSLSPTRLQKLNRYVRSAITDNNSEMKVPNQVTITNSSFLLQVANNARWIDWTGKNGGSTFGSHNLDNPLDQQIAFIAFISLNTWLKNIRMFDFKKRKNE